ncbi:hypothetical protein OG735_26400 [Streptomyces sp. NBC_01210]|uniref:hypothetical protein n=1 Tax=Streptomyces sp. NBC_01210 TaxID=2903774 RepID=UPI002E10EA6C|nr:hypothetical protein OG735_26400 [Streptomyces sp. NBC_01210]
MTGQHSDPVRRLMRDLRILAGCDALLTALPGGQSVDDALVLAARHAESAATTARQILTERQEQRQGGGR